MGFTAFDPNMLMGGGGGVGNPPPGNDPLTDMFFKAANGGGPASAPSGPPPSGGGAPPSNSLAPSAPVSPVPVGNPAGSDQPGLFKKMLMDFTYGGTQALKKQLGMPTDAEMAQSRQQELDRQQNMQLAQRRQAAEEQNQASEAQMRAVQIAKMRKEMKDPGGETPADEFARRKTEGTSLGLQGDDLIRYILKHDPIVDKNKPNPNEFSLAMDAANPDPRIAGPAKQALANAAAYERNKKVPKDAGGAPQDPMPWVMLMKSGQISMDGLNKAFPGKDYAPFRAQVLLGANQAGVDFNAPMTQGASTQAAAIKGALDDVQKSIEMIDKNKLSGDDTPWLVSHPLEIGKYKLGMTPDSEYGQHMASMSLGRVKQAGMVLNKSSRAWPALQLALEHTPSIHYSPKANRMRLNDIKNALQDSLDELKTTGTRSGLPAQPELKDPLNLRK